VKWIVIGSFLALVVGPGIARYVLKPALLLALWLAPFAVAFAAAIGLLYLAGGR